MSEDTARMIDEEVKRIVSEGYEKAQELLTKHLDELHTLAQGLLEYETLSGEEIKALLRGEPPHRDSGEPEAPSGPSSSVPSAGATVGPVGGIDPEPQGT